MEATQAADEHSHDSADRCLDALLILEVPALNSRLNFKLRILEERVLESVSATLGHLVRELVSSFTGGMEFLGGSDSDAALLQCYQSSKKQLADWRATVRSLRQTKDSMQKVAEDEKRKCEEKSRLLESMRRDHLQETRTLQEQLRDSTETCGLLGQRLEEKHRQYEDVLTRLNALRQLATGIEAEVDGGDSAQCSDSPSRCDAGVPCGLRNEGDKSMMVQAARETSRPGHLDSAIREELESAIREEVAALYTARSTVAVGNPEQVVVHDLPSAPLLERSVDARSKHVESLQAPVTETTPAIGSSAGEATIGSTERPHNDSVHTGLVCSSVSAILHKHGVATVEAEVSEARAGASRWPKAPNTPKSPRSGPNRFNALHNNRRQKLVGREVHPRIGTPRSCSGSKEAFVSGMAENGERLPAGAAVAAVRQDRRILTSPL